MKNYNLEIEGNILGVAKVGEANTLGEVEGYLSSFKINKEARGNGHGGKFIQSLVDKGIVTSLSVNVLNSPAITIYTKAGFKIVTIENNECGTYLNMDYAPMDIKRYLGDKNK